MRFICMHKGECESAAYIPNAELIVRIGHLVEEMTQAGVFHSTAGLRTSSQGVRLNFSAGKRKLTRGPFAGDNELSAGFYIVKVSSIDVAVAWATRFAEIMEDIEIDVRPVSEPWDIGLCPRPQGEDKTRYMLLYKADANTEAGVLPSAAQKTALAALVKEMTQAGILQTVERLKPSAQGVRLHFRDGQRHTVDGPFAESKELIAGYCIQQLDNLEEAAHWAQRFANIIGDVEIDIRPLYEPADFASPA